MIEGKNNEEQNAFVRSKEKFTFRKEMLGIALAILMFVMLMALFIHQVFFVKKYEVIVPDLPNHKSYDVSVVDGNGDTNDINAGEKKKLKVSYKVVDDFYKQGILLSGTLVNNLDDNLIITSGLFATTPFISRVSYEGKLDWLTKIEDSKYTGIQVYKTVSMNNEYYVAALCKNSNNEKDIVVYRFDSNGKMVNSKVIETNTKGRIAGGAVVNGKVAFVYELSNNPVVQLLNSDLTSEKIGVCQNNNEVCGLVLKVTATNDLINLAVNNKIAIVNANDKSVSVVNLNNTIDEESYPIDYLNGVIYKSKDKVTKYDASGNVVKEIDYSKMKLENVKDYVTEESKHLMTDDAKSDFSIKNIHLDSDYIVVCSETTFSRLYDVYDKDLKLVKRYIFDITKYAINEGMLIDFIYSKDKIHEVYSYGVDTPSIMISTIE